MTAKAKPDEILDLNLMRPTEDQVRKPAAQGEIASPEGLDAMKRRFGSCVMGFSGRAAATVGR